MNIKKVLFIILKKKGSSFIGLLAAFGIMSVSSVTLIGYIQNVSSELKNTTGTYTTSFDIHTNVIASLRGLLIKKTVDQSGNEGQQSRWGICSLVKSPGKLHGVDLVKIKLSSTLTGLAAQSFGELRWKAFFKPSEYELDSSGASCRKLDSSFQSGHFSRCFRYTGKKSETASKVYVIARIVPKQFPDFSVIDFSTGSELDAKLVMFELQAIVGENNAQSGEVAPLKYVSVAWSDEVGECNIQVRGGWTNVQFSGTGVGRLSDRLVVNHPFFSGQLGVCQEVEFGEIPSSIIMGGHFLENGASIAGNHLRNKKIVCRKNIYRCPGESGQNTDYFNSIKFTTYIINNYGGLLWFNKMNFTFLDEDGDEIDGADDGALDSLKVEGISTTGNVFQANTDLSSTVELQPGVNKFGIALADKNSGSLASFCNDVCTDGKERYPSMSISFGHSLSDNNCSYKKDYTEDRYRVGCNVCHSKMCHKIGIGVFGPVRDEGGLQGLMDEPLDGAIPECALKKSISYDLPSISSGTGDCVAMRATDMDSFKNFASAQYEYQNCSTSLPVLCFAYGHYLPAITIASPGSDPTIVTSNFEGAQEACYKMGRELVTQDHLVDYFKRFWNNIALDTNPTVVSALTNFGLSVLGSTHFEYINNASRGLFIAPSYNVSALSNKLKDSYLQKFIDSSHSKLWIAMEKDAGSQLIGSIPQASKATSPFSVFTRRELPARALILKDTNSISDSGTDTVLTYNIRYKGVYNVSSSGSNQALCRKGPGDFILSNSTTLANAPAACKSADANARFIPPVSSLEWAKAMALLNPNSEMYPFPSPGDFSGENYSHSRSVSAPVAWVALTKNGSGSSAKSWRLNKAYFPDSDSVFKTESIPSASANYMGIIDYKGKPVMPSFSTFLSFDFSVYKKACFSDGSNGQVVLKASVAADESCASGQTEVTKDNLKMTSIRFMSDWVQTNKSGAFILDKRLVDQAITQAKKKKCSNDCQSAKVSCDDTCDTNYNNCRLFCIRANPVGSPFLASCMRACAGTRDTCKEDSCSSTFTSCKSDCDTTYNTSGHAHIWFL